MNMDVKKLFDFITSHITIYPSLPHFFDHNQDTSPFVEFLWQEAGKLRGDGHTKVPERGRNASKDRYIEASPPFCYSPIGKQSS